MKGELRAVTGGEVIVEGSKRGSRKRTGWEKNGKVKDAEEMGDEDGTQQVVT